jgi:two-component system, OmpR family, response regulator
MKVLIIEDHPEAAQTLRAVLGSLYTVETAQSGQEGIFKAKTGGCDLILLDLGLGDMEGYTVCTEIRARQINIPILVVTGRSQAADKVSLLEGGADDYLVKPFHRQELLARIKALLRRPPLLTPPEVVVLDGLAIDPGKRQVRYKEQVVNLRRKEFDLLYYLVRSLGQVVTRSMILDHVWESDVDQFSNTVDVHIKYLRDKIDRRFNIKLIQTVPGVGYKIAL